MAVVENLSTSDRQREGPSSVFVEFQHRNVALHEMQKVINDETGMIKKYAFFPLDDRVCEHINPNRRNYEELAECFLNTLKSSATYEQTAVDKFLNEARYLSVVLLVTKNGLMYGINNNKKLHARLRKYNDLLKFKCSGKCTNMTGPDCEGMCYFEGITEGYQENDSGYAVLFMARFVHDRTQLRRGKKIATVNGFIYFLELDSAIIRKMKENAHFNTNESKDRLFSQPSCISQFKLEGGEEMEDKDILSESLTIASSNKITVLFHEHASGNSWLPVVTPFVKSSTLFVEPQVVYDQETTSYVEPPVVGSSTNNNSANTKRKRTATGNIHK
uniref:Non-structural maintenance of chromosomes element 4 n=1 Tax=Caenorhabditis tropicalis TaxID=1561998 RepID=A0A1I7TCR6_9PELO